MPNPDCTDTLDVPAVDPEKVDAQVNLILDSPLFKTAPTLSNVLRFITQKAIQGRSAEISEYTIATQVFGRGAEFDPSSDTIVRTQVYRLRAKLEQYYSGPGTEDTLIIDVPKGHYVPIFRPARRETTVSTGQPAPTVVIDPPAARRNWVRRLAGVVLVAVLCYASWILGARSTQSLAASRPSPSPVVSAFWQGFLGSDRLPVVSYSNHRFLGNSNGTLVPLGSGPAADRGAPFLKSGRAPSNGALTDLEAISGPLYFQDDYTGVGEVLATVSLLKVLEYRADRVEVKRSHLVNTFDLRSHNVIILGSGDPNPLLSELPSPQKFVRVRGAGKWQGYIRNLSPEAGEASTYQMVRDPASGVIKAEYATVSVLPGIAPGKRILVLGGLSTSGTMAAASSVTEPEGITQLATKLGVHDPQNPADWPATFESIWRVELSRGLDVVSFRIVAAKTFKTQR